MLEWGERVAWLSQTDLNTPDRTLPPDLPERAVLGSGRPVLIIPYAGVLIFFVGLVARVVKWGRSPVPRKCQN